MTDRRHPVSPIGGWWHWSRDRFQPSPPPADAAPRDVLPAAPDGPDAPAEVLRRAVDIGDEHVIKFTVPPIVPGRG